MGQSALRATGPLSRKRAVVGMGFAASSSRAQRLLPSGLLQAEERALCLEPAAVARERAVAADYAVARHHDRERVARVRAPHRASTVGAPQLAGDLPVAARLAVGNPGE